MSSSIIPGQVANCHASLVQSCHGSWAPYDDYPGRRRFPTYKMIRLTRRGVTTADLLSALGFSHLSPLGPKSVDDRWLCRIYCSCFSSPSDIPPCPSFHFPTIHSQTIPPVRLSTRYHHPPKISFYSVFSFPPFLYGMSFYCSAEFTDSYTVLL